MSSSSSEIKEFKKLILRETDEAFRQHPFQQDSRKGRNYIFDITRGAKTLLYFGGHHTNDPADPMFEDIKKRFEEMRPDLVFVEGMMELNDHKDYFIKKYKSERIEDKITKGENLYTLKLAIDADADFETPEPSMTEQITYLLKEGHRKEDIFTERMYRIVSQYIRQLRNNKSIDDCILYLRPFLDYFRKSSDWSNKELDVLEKQLFEELDLYSSKYSDQANPNPHPDIKQTVINDIARKASRFIDEYQLERIAEGLKTHDRLFIVYGSAHAVRIEPALRALLLQYESQ